MNHRAVVLLIVASSLISLGALVTVSPSYLTGQGFPLDDAWIHAVYGREVWRSGSFAYNPGVPATGSTSPLWSALLAVPHFLGSGVGDVVVLIKLLGFGLHILTALLLYVALKGEGTSVAAASGAVLVAAHPDLVSASVSGMEVPLATLIVVALLWAAKAGRVGLYAALSVLGVLARPELALLGAVALGAGRRRWHLLAGGLFGSLVAIVLVALRNIAVSGLPLPGPFYAKVGGGTMSLPQALSLGFGDLLAQIPIVDSSVLLAVAAAISLDWLIRSGAGDSVKMAAASLLGGLVYCAVSFLLVAPIDPDSFYHQRYVLPVLPLIIGSLPVLSDALFQRYSPRRQAAVFQICLLGVLAGSLVVDAPGRFSRLSSDARNIDDVQVRLGRALASASPSDIVWVVDAGASRYFGSAYVVDLMGLNTPPLLGAGAQEFLDRHPPTYLEIVPTWSRLDDRSARELTGMLFDTSTAYTATSIPAMQRHWLVPCSRDWHEGRLMVRTHTFRFNCPRTSTEASGPFRGDGPGDAS